tara:strand:- start:2003 stop:2233 length:231 start_codon:yes stop_codon:yes gene_type:complete
MSKEKFYTKEELLKKTPYELVVLIESLIDEVESLRFMLDEFYNAEKSIGKNIETELRKIITDNFLVLNQETDDTEH